MQQLLPEKKKYQVGLILMEGPSKVPREIFYQSNIKMEGPGKMHNFTCKCINKQKLRQLSFRMAQLTKTSGHLYSILIIHGKKQRENKKQE